MRYAVEIAKMIDFLLVNDRFHILVILGAPGWAKTHSTREALLAKGVEYELMGAYSTPLALFNKLAEATNRVHVLDDTSGVLGNHQALSILNAASWPGADAGKQRRVIWTSTTERAVTDSFDFTGKIILLSNYMSELPQARAFVSRALHLEIEIEADLVRELLIEAAASKAHFPETERANAVAEFLGDLAHRYAPGRISLRSLELGYQFATHYPGEWQDLLVRMLPKPDFEKQEPEAVVVELDRSGKKVSEQFAEFAKRTGFGRRRFFYIRGKLGLSSEAKSLAAKAVALSRSKTGRKTGKKVL